MFDGHDAVAVGLNEFVLRLCGTGEGRRHLSRPALSVLFQVRHVEDGGLGELDAESRGVLLDGLGGVWDDDAAVEAGSGRTGFTVAVAGRKDSRIGGSVRHSTVPSRSWSQVPKKS